ncbi:MAG TPA: beta galactosidase jelly roll domain-containing protein, partial [Candidatus Baltobacteraceae bacterium]|nr:beta galactosidase jelly roll domain-containing protein [Candidatus Baltobacteraceae bacterium]
GAELARSVAVPCDAATSQKDVTVVERRAPDGGRYFFVRTGEHVAPREGTAKVKENPGGEISFNYQLEPFGSKILYLPAGATNAGQGEWLPKAAPAIERPADLPPGVTIVSAKIQADPGPSNWTKMNPGETLEQLGIYDSGFVFYRTKISSRTATNFMVEFPDGDAVLATVNDRPVAPAGGTMDSAVFALPAGSSKVQLLYENHGFANGGSDMEQQAGISSAQFVRFAQVKGTPVGGWRMRLVNGTSKRPEVQPDFDDRGWPPVAVDDVDANQLTPGQIAVFRTRIEMSAADLNNAKWDLNFGRIDDLGWVYVNGKSAGKTTDWSSAYSFNVTKHLLPGANVIAVIVKNIGGGGGLGAPTLGRELEGVPAPLESFGIPAGVRRQWWNPDFNDRRWQTVTIGSGAPETNNLLTWYRMNFQLQPVKPGVWVPWRLHLEATGNGFLYLNGHAIGRYWQAGPQHDFFLPECWLNFGAGRMNNLTLSLRPLDKGAAIQSAIVEPYTEFAEKR